MTEKLQCSSDDCRANLAAPVRPGAENVEHVANKPAVMPFFLFDRGDARPFFRIRHRMPMASVGIAGSLFAGIGELKKVDQVGPRVTHSGASISDVPGVANSSHSVENLA